MKIEIMMTDAKDVGPDGWRHVTAHGLAQDETEARTAAQAVKEMFLPDSYELHERVPFEYKDTGRGSWHLFGRFSFRPH